MKFKWVFLFCCSFLTVQAQNDFDYVFVFLNHKDDQVEMPQADLDKIMDGHMANIKRLASEGKLIDAGPFEGGGGIFIFKSPSTSQVQEWVSTDPGVQANRWNIEMMPFKPRIGNVCNAPQPYEMVNYSFIRFVSVITKFSVHHAAENFSDHELFIKDLEKTGNIVAEGIFANQDGAILIMKGEVDPALIEADPAVMSGFLRPVYKTLYIAKGSFCEK